MADDETPEQKEERICAALRAEAMNIAAELIAKHPERRDEILRRLDKYEPMKKPLNN